LGKIRTKLEAIERGTNKRKKNIRDSSGKRRNQAKRVGSQGVDKRR